MTELKPRIHDESNGLDYVLVGDYYVPDLKLPEEHRRNAQVDANYIRAPHTTAVCATLPALACSCCSPSPPIYGL